MSQPPAPYDRSYSFTDFSTNNPNAQQPGQKIDQELNNVLTALNDTQDRLGELQADDGKLRESSLRMETLGPAVAPFVSASAIDAINTAGSTQLTAVNTAGSTQVGLVNSAGATVLSDINAVINSSYAVSAIAASVSASDHAADAYDSRQRADAFRVQAAEQAGLAAYQRDRAGVSADNASLSAINAEASKNISQSFAGSCNTLKNAAQSAATLAEYWNGLAQAASSAADASAADARAVVESALTITLEGIQPYVDAAANSAYEAAGSAASISSAGYITDAPSDGTTYGRNNGSWEVVGGGGGDYLPLTGGTMTGQIISDVGNGFTSTLSDGGLSVTGDGNNSYLTQEGVGFSCSLGGSQLNFNQLYLRDENTGDEMFVTPNGLQGVESITFADASVQTTAYTGGGGSFLPLTGGTMTGSIVFDGTSGQYISKGNFDTSRGGNYGISLVCSIGYEFNWQAGWLTTTNQGSTTPRPLYLDSLAGTTLRVWNSSTDTGTEVTHNGIVMNGGAVIDMAASTTDSEVGGWGFGVELTGVSAEQSTVEYNQIRTKNAEYSFTATPTQVKVFEDTNNLGVTIAHDSIAIQHIDTPNVTAYVTNEYIGFEDMGGTPHSAFVEHDVITVQNETGNTAVRASSVIVTQGDLNSQLFPDSLNINNIGSSAYVGSGDWGIDNTDGRSLYLAANNVRLQSPGIDPELARPQVDLTTAALTFQLESEVPAATYAATGITFPDATVQVTAAATNNTQLATTVADYNGSYDITAGDANTIITPSQATDFYFNDDDHNPFPTGAQIVFVNMSGNINFYAREGAQILSADNLYTITKNYGTAVAIKLNATQWSLSGNLA